MNFSLTKMQVSWQKTRIEMKMPFSFLHKYEISRQVSTKWLKDTASAAILILLSKKCPFSALNAFRP
jgi:hypothetical protein